MNISPRAGLSALLCAVALTLAAACSDSGSSAGSGGMGGNPVPVTSSGTTTPTSTSTSASSSSSGTGGSGGCFSGTPSTEEQFLDACNGLTCTDFTKTLPLLDKDGSRPALP